MFLKKNLKKIKKFQRNIRICHVNIKRIDSESIERYDMRVFKVNIYQGASFVYRSFKLLI